MKIRIVDLMDHYYGDTGKLDAPRARGTAPKTQFAPRGPHRALLMAAVLLLVVTGGVALGLGLGRTPNGAEALTEGGSAAESIQEMQSAQEAVSVQETLPSELSGIVPEIENQQAAPEGMVQAGIRAQVIDGAYDIGATSCEGNLLYVGGSYYTMTENGPEPVEVQNLTTTVELYGTWNVSLDYAVIDGELCFRTLKRPNNFDSATAYVLKGSSDTVMLMIFRQDMAIVDRCSYMFFYNIFTGEITDPLANVPELFDHGSMSSVRFNNSCTRALVHYYGVDDMEQGDNYTYVCDLATGEMQRVSTLLEPYLPEDEADGTVWYENSMAMWADDDTLLLWQVRSVPQGNIEEMTDKEILEQDPWDRSVWLFAYNVAAGELQYMKQNVDMQPMNMGTGDFGNRYLHYCEYDPTRFRIVNAYTGEAYTVDMSVGSPSGNDWSCSESKWIIRDGNAICLVDDTQMAWTDLGAELAWPEEAVNYVHLVTDDWLCLMTETQVYCYRIPDDLSMTPWSPE